MNSELLIGPSLHVKTTLQLIKMLIWYMTKVFMKKSLYLFWQVFVHLCHFRAVDVLETEIILMFKS